VDDFTIEFKNKELEHVVSLTPADRKFIDEIIKIVDNSWEDGNNDIMFDGSDQSIRSKFELYLFSLLYSIKLYTNSPSESALQAQIQAHQIEDGENYVTSPEPQFQQITQELIS